ncbi:hypothetical protein KCP76_17980 [Salmonella enterica subsp. enterica serovar Weltevreden]|nr:hypothetical protein KCP76_17980 [Salmonella enterica subsp. enterica serovar Weltevreden]
MQTILNNALATPFTPWRIVRSGFGAARWRLMCLGIGVRYSATRTVLSRPMRSSLRFLSRYSRTVLPVGRASPHPGGVVRCIIALVFTL